MSGESRLNRPGVLNLIGLATLVIVLLVLALAALTLPAALSSASNSENSNRTDDLNACRSEFRSDIDDANLALAKARTTVDLLTNEGLQAAVQQDDDALGAVLAQGPAARKAIETATDELELATQRYQAAVTQSRTDPDAFVRRCGQ